LKKIRRKYTLKPIKNQKFGKLTFTGSIKTIDTIIEGKTSSPKRYLYCECECGNKKWIYIGSLYHKQHPTQSCGCMQKQRSREVNSIKTIDKITEK